MITPRLEKLILQDKAAYQTYVQSMQSGAILVPDNKTVIITDITYFHFVDAEENETSENGGWNSRLIHQLTIASKDKRDIFGIRENLVKTIGETDGATNFNSKSVGGHVHFDTYLVHSKDIYIDVVRQSNPTQWNAVVVGSSPDSQNFNAPQPPLGRGKGAASVPAVIRYEITPTRELRDYPQRPPFLGSDSAVQFQVPEIPGTALEPPSILPGNEESSLKFPLINIGYVMIYNPIGEEVL